MPVALGSPENRRFSFPSLFLPAVFPPLFFLSTFLRWNPTVRWFRCSPTPERIRSARSVDDDDGDGDDDDDGDLHSSLSKPSLFLFSSFASVILHLGSPATLYRGASIKFIRPLVAATLQDGSRRLATLCFSTLTLSSLLSLSLPLSRSPSAFSLYYSLSPGSNLSLPRSGPPGPSRTSRKFPLTLWGGWVLADVIRFNEREKGRAEGSCYVGEGGSPGG